MRSKSLAPGPVPFVGEDVSEALVSLNRDRAREVDGPGGEVPGPPYEATRFRLPNATPHELAKLANAPPAAEPTLLAVVGVVVASGDGEIVVTSGDVGRRPDEAAPEFGASVEVVRRRANPNKMLPMPSPAESAGDGVPDRSARCCCWS